MERLEDRFLLLHGNTRSRIHDLEANLLGVQPFDREVDSADSCGSDRLLRRPEG